MVPKLQVAASNHGIGYIFLHFIPTENVPTFEEIVDQFKIFSWFSPYKIYWSDR